jgi:hypothetical protein
MSSNYLYMKTFNLLMLQTTPFLTSLPQLMQSSLSFFLKARMKKQSTLMEHRYDNVNFNVLRMAVWAGKQPLA